MNVYSPDGTNDATKPWEAQLKRNITKVVDGVEGTTPMLAIKQSLGEYVYGTMNIYRNLRAARSWLPLGSQDWMIKQSPHLCYPRRDEDVGPRMMTHHQAVVTVS
jgi:hypothetical protein